MFSLDCTASGVCARGGGGCLVLTLLLQDQKSSSIYQRLQSVRQAWCNLQVTLCDPCLSALEVVTTMRYTNRLILYFTLLYFSGSTQIPARTELTTSAEVHQETARTELLAVTMMNEFNQHIEAVLTSCEADGKSAVRALPTSRLLPTHCDTSAITHQTTCSTVHTNTHVMMYLSSHLDRQSILMTNSSWETVSRPHLFHFAREQVLHRANSTISSTKVKSLTPVRLRIVVYGG